MTVAAERRRAQLVQRFAAQTRLLTDWFDRLDPDLLDRPTVLPGWDVRLLAAHLIMMLQGVETLPGRPSGERALPLHAYVARYREQVDDIEERTRAAASTHADVVVRLREAAERAVTAAQRQWPTVVAGWRGPLRTEDFLTSRLFELVTHADDLNRSELVMSGSVDPVPIDPQALGGAVRGLAGVLADRFPGRSVEVRVPPYAAVQCGTADAAPAPSHTRGTPPNVVEIEPLLFVRLCTGRTQWADAVGGPGLTASGTRADLSTHLPLLS